MGSNRFTTIDKVGKRYRFSTDLPIVGDKNGLIYTKYQVESEHLARRFYRVVGNSPVADLCCGIGMTSIALAKYFSQVYAVDNNKLRLTAGQLNAETFGVKKQIIFINDDVTKPRLYQLLLSFGVKAITIDPGWRNNQNTKIPCDKNNPTIIDIINTRPSIPDIFDLIVSVTPNICLKLPNTTNLSQLKVFGKHEVEHIFYAGMGSLRYYNVYFGQLVRDRTSSFTVPK